MSTFHLKRIGFVAPALALGALLCIANGAIAAPAEDLRQMCRKLGNDDTIRPYSRDLYHETVKAFRTLSPDVKDTPGDTYLETQAQYRCMNGKVMVCFLGTDLPCVKMNARRANPGADRFCREDRSEGFVAAAATGNDAVYSYRCRNRKAEVFGTIWKLDQRGFARKLWIALPDG